MPAEKRQEISEILEAAQRQVGSDFLLESADLFAPQFNKPPVSIYDFFVKRTSYMHYLTTKYKNKIDEARK
jgi:hypothetical protein